VHELPGLENVPGPLEAKLTVPVGVDGAGSRSVRVAGIFAESAALVVADGIAAVISGADPPAPFEGSGNCYAEFGAGLVSKVEVNFLRREGPEAQRYDPSREYALEKEEFGATRRARWFGR
jgi:sulfide:quinone oxidoreductase